MLSYHGFRFLLIFFRSLLGYLKDCNVAAHSIDNDIFYVVINLSAGSTLHTAAEPAVRSAVKILVSQRNDTIKAFFFAANKNKNSAQVPLASTSS